MRDYRYKKSNSCMKKLKSNKGQIIVEYMLLLVIAVAVATLIVSQVSSRSETNPGFLIVKWRQIIQAIGTDNATGPNTQTP